MEGISDKAIKTNYAENKFRYNSGSELQNKEFSDGSGWEMYDANARMYDPQIGRFGGIDALSGKTEGLSPYSFGVDDPVVFNYPTGQKVAPPKMTPQQMADWVASIHKNFRFDDVDDVGNTNGSDGSGGGGSSSGDYSEFWSTLLAFAEGDDAAGYVVDRDGKIISNPSNENLITVWLQTSSKDGQNMDLVTYQYLGTLGGVISSDKIISELLHDDVITAGYMSPHDFKEAVDDHSVWDYKTNTDYIYGAAALFDQNNSKYGFKTNFLFGGYSMTAEDFGNFHFGVVGLANGNFSETMLSVAAGLVQIRDGHSRPEWQNTTYWGDDPNDHYWIQQGFNYYHSNY